MSDTKKIAEAFAAVLKTWLTPAQMTAVRKRNRAQRDNRCCASHDFCDANMAMHEAFTKAVGREPSFDDDGVDTKLWNDAWDLAVKEHLS